MYATGPGRTAFQQWRLNHGLPENLDDLNDNDGDALVLLAEYALAADPLTSDPPPYSGALIGGQLTLTYQRIKAATDTDVTAEVSSDLVSWLSTTADVEQRWQVSDTAVFETITARALTPNRFIRLRVTRP
jgi:hypothetical protein